MSLRLKNAVCFMLDMELTYDNNTIERAIYDKYPEWELLQKDTVWLMELFLDPSKGKIHGARKKLINEIPKNNKKKRDKLKSKLLKQKNDEFYSSKPWKKLRKKIHKNWDRTCMKCKRKKKVMHVDHIKPRSIYPKLELDPLNMQILCKSCNYEKSNKNCTDYRTEEFKLSIVKEFNLKL